MENRYAQTELMLSTFSHFSYRGSDRVVMRGSIAPTAADRMKMGKPNLGK